MKNKGFTLIEMLIAVLIFSLIIGAGIGLFFSALKLQKSNLAYRQLLNQAGYISEYLSRAVRMAKKDKISCIDGSNFQESETSLKFATYNDECWRFFLENSRLKMEKNGEEYFLTSDDFEILSLKFVVAGDEAGDELQPRVTMLMDIRAKGEGSQPRLRIQTTVSQRNLDM